MSGPRPEVDSSEDNSDNETAQALSEGRAQIQSAEFFTVKPSELHFKSVLGRGAQANVYKALWVRSFAATTSSIMVAVKWLNSDSGLIYRDREAVTLLTDHPSLLKCFDSTHIPPYLVVTEFCAGGSLFDLLYNTQQELSLIQRVKILVDVAAGMRYLHLQKPCILHRDLKSSNILLTKPIKSSSQEPVAKVADFGLARELTSTSSYAMMTVGVGTLRWMAPEVFDSDGQGFYDERADVFSFAILMYEVLARTIPYGDKFPLESTDPRIGLHVYLGLRPDLDLIPDCPPVLRTLMEQSWHKHAEDRPDFEVIERQLRGVLSTLRSYKAREPPDVDLLHPGPGVS